MFQFGRRSLLVISLAALSLTLVSCSYHPVSVSSAPPETLPQKKDARESSFVEIPVITNSADSTEKQFYFDWPVDSARMSRGYLPNRRKPHLGIDLAARKGTNVYASHDGVVIYTGREFKGYGKMIMLEGPDGWATLYAHFSKILAKEGQVVKQGDVIGAMGSTGRSTGSHLHFEIRKLKGPVDPLLYLPKIRRLASHSN